METEVQKRSLKEEKRKRRPQGRFGASVGVCVTGTGEVGRDAVRGEADPRPHRDLEATGSNLHFVPGD